VPLFKKYDIPVLYNFKEEDMKWVVYKPKARMHVLDHIFPDGIKVPDYFFGKNIVHLPTVKCHIYTTTTGAMKNAFGGLLATHRHYTHSWIHRTLVDLLAIQKEIHSGPLRHHGRHHGGQRPRAAHHVPGHQGLHAGLFGSGGHRRRRSEDDGLRPDEPRVHERGPRRWPRRRRSAGHRDRGRRHLGESWGFQVGDNGASKVGDFMWFGPMKKFQKLFFHTPLVNAFIFGSEAYHDYYRWPLKDKKTFEDWRANTHWGRLFAAYERGESERVTGPAKKAESSARV
jgi:hypothetical protein